MPRRRERDCVVRDLKGREYRLALSDAERLESAGRVVILGRVATRPHDDDEMTREDNEQ